MSDESRIDDRFLYELARDGETAELVAHLKSADNPNVRARAAEILGDFADMSRSIDEAEVTRGLVSAVLEDDNDGVRARAIDSLYRHGSESLDRLIAEMADFDASEASDPVTARQLIAWLDAEYPEFRMVAATVLGRLGDEQVIPRLVEAFDDRDPRVRERAVRACGRIGDERVIESLGNRLDDPEPLVQRAAANALVAIGTPAALERLMPAARANDEQVRHVAAAELSGLRNTKPLVVLVRLLTDDSEEVRDAATLSLIELIAADTDREEKTRRVVAGQLRTVDDAELIPRLLEILSASAEPGIRRTVVWLFGRVLDPEAGDIEAVHEALLDALAEEELADLAEESLVELESEALETRLRIFTEQQEGSREAIERAEAVLDQVGTDRVTEVVRNSVDYTYVREPADYTRKKETERR